jgi:hypothetical protein
VNGREGAYSDRTLGLRVRLGNLGSEVEKDRRRGSISSGQAAEHLSRRKDLSRRNDPISNMIRG